ncbi:MAG TPA: hypothetical protein VGH12_09215 [Steroidobacteraceae bacterium]
MHRLFYASILPLFLAGLPTLAASRDDLVNQIEASYVSGTLIRSDSPIIEVLLESAKSANPNVAPDVWQSVKTDSAQAITKLLTGRGGVMDTIIRESLAPLSDKELQTLSQILSDPVYQKFQQVMSAPQTQKQMFDSMRQVGAHLVDTINGILAAHHLNTPH